MEIATNDYSQLYERVDFLLVPKLERKLVRTTRELSFNRNSSSLLLTIKRRLKASFENLTEHKPVVRITPLEWHRFQHRYKSRYLPSQDWDE